MKNRPRPRVPDKVQIAVAIRQLASLTRLDGERQDVYLERLLVGLAAKLGCPRAELRLDHDPPLRARDYNPRVKKIAARYTPNANDPDALLYRPHSAEFEGSHHVKTNVRGDHGQYSDTVLIKRERRREKKLAEPEPNAKMRAMAVQARRFQPPKHHAKIPARANPWPPKGSRSLRGRNR